VLDCCIRGDDAHVGTVAVDPALLPR
jgi:hypothetical protein